MHDAVLPLASVVVQITDVIPIGKVVELKLLVVEATAQLSAVTGVPSDATVAVHDPATTFAVILAGHVMVGLILSITVTVCEQVAVFPLPSVTVQITVLAPMEYVVDG